MAIDSTTLLDHYNTAYALYAPPERAGLPAPDRIGCGDFFQLAEAVVLFVRAGRPPSQILREDRLVAQKETGHSRPWTNYDECELKEHSKARTPVTVIAQKMKRTEGALRRKAGILGIGLGHRGPRR